MKFAEERGEINDTVRRNDEMIWNDEVDKMSKEKQRLYTLYDRW